MKTASIYRKLPVPFAIALLSATSLAHAAVGARVLLQEWNPLMPQNQSVRVLSNSPNVVSDAIQSAWSQARPAICAQLKGAMGKGGAAGGQTLYDIDCQLDQTPAFTVTSAGANGLMATLSIGGYVAATSTTPTALGSYADPRFSLALKANMVLALTLQPNVNETLHVSTARFSLSDATLDSHNFSGDILKFVANDLIPFFHGPNYKRLAENAINGVGIDVANRFNTAFAPVNNLLRGPSGAVRVAVWGKPDAITIAFGPREIPLPSGGTVSGALRWDTSKIGTPGNCDGFIIDAVVQTGPAPLRDPGGYYEPGDAPKRKVGSFQQVPGSAAGNCRYRMTGLAAGLPNEFTAHRLQANLKRADNSVHSVHYVLAGDGWDGHSVTPQPSAERNYLVKTMLDDAMVLVPSGTLKHEQQKRFDPHVNPNPVMGLGTQAVTPASKNAALAAALVGQSKTAVTPALSTGSITQNRGVAVSLNPQPLPPAGVQATASPLFSSTSAFVGRGR